MKAIVCLVAIIACANARVAVSQETYERNPEYYHISRIVRHPRDLTWGRPVGTNGRVFGTLGSDDSSLFGRAGYQHKIFDDHRGTLNAQAYGSRHLSPYGDTTKLGGGLNWANPNAQASVDVSRPIGGHTGLNAAASGVWDVGKNTHISAGGFYDQQHLGHGRADYGVQGQIKHDF